MNESPDSELAHLAGACCTVVTTDHLPYARVLMDSVRQYWPAATRHVLIVDGDPSDRPIHGEHFEITCGSEIAPRGFLKRAFLNSPGGLCALLKPMFVASVLRRTGAPVGVHADGDSQFYTVPQALVRAARHAPFVIVPHTLRPVGGVTAVLRTDGDLARAGTYNSGLFAVRNDSAGLACLDLWAQGMWADAWLDQTFAWDQIWVTLLRHYWPATSVLLDPAYNVAYWNIHERDLRDRSDGGTNAGTVPLVHFHFSFFDRHRPDLLVHRGGQQFTAGSATVRRLCADYADRLARADVPTAARSIYRFGQFRDGRPISELHREYFRFRVAPIAGEDPDPFDPAYAPPGFAGLRQLYRADELMVRTLRWLKKVPVELRALGRNR